MMPRLGEIAKITRSQGGRKRRSNLFTKAIAKNAALGDMTKSEKKFFKKKHNGNNNSNNK